MQNKEKALGLTTPKIPHQDSHALFSVVAEMNYQDIKWGADRNQDNFVWATILGEEVGEACQAALHDHFGGSHAGTLRDELIQVAAVALQWVEQLDREDSAE